MGKLGLRVITEQSQKSKEKCIKHINNTIILDYSQEIDAYTEKRPIKGIFILRIQVFCLAYE